MEECGVMGGALDGVKVIDTTGFVAAPTATRILADWGATVIKLEHPKRPDTMRSVLHGVMKGQQRGSTYNYAWDLCNRNKKSMTLDLTHPGAGEVIRRLVAAADVFVTHFRPYELEKFDLEYETMSAENSGLIFASLTGYGRRGPDRNKPGFDMTGFWARAGSMHMLAEPGAEPPLQRPGYGDVLTGMALAMGVITALFQRSKTGRGQLVEASLLNMGLFTMSYDLAGSLAIEDDLPQERRTDRENPLNLSYKTADGRWLILCCVVPDLYWGGLCEAFGRPEWVHDPRFDSFATRAANHDELRGLFEQEFASRPLAEWRKILDDAGVPWAPAQTLGEVIQDPQVIANELVLEYDSRENGRVRAPGPPVKLADSPAKVRSTGPEFGENTEEVLLDVGYTWDDIIEFKSAGLIA